MKHLLMCMYFFFSISLGFAQGKIEGVIVDPDTNEALPGATVVEKGTSNGTITNMNGDFILDVGTATGEILISFIGYNTRTVKFDTNQSKNLGAIELEQDDVTLKDIVVVGNGIIDLVKDRQTPIAVSTIKGKEIALKSGNQEFPEIMKNTPSVYVETQARGYGESNINIRGFSQENLAVLFNGQPINGMEDGNVYWSNWQGIADIANAVQIQRGLGSSKLAISSVGATINIVTKATDKARGGKASALYGNDNYMKATASYSSGMQDSKWGYSVLLSHWQGDGYNDGTKGQGQTYFFSVGYKPNDRHAFNLSITGAPQWHEQNYAKSIKKFDKDGNGDISRSESRFNDNWGYRNGKKYTWRKNFYHKPVINMNWDWQFDEKNSLSTVFYGSYGQGGVTAPYGNFSLYNNTRDANGQIDFDAIRASNLAITPNADGKIYGSYLDDGSQFGDTDFATRVISLNMHRWFGMVSNYKRYISDELTLNVGIDLRTYFGEHFRLAEDMLGLDGFLDENINTPGFQDQFPGGRLYTREHQATPYMFYSYRNENQDDKVDFNSAERISYQGVFGQIEYSKDKISAFFQGAFSNQNYQRFDYHTYSDPDEQKSKKLHEIGYNIKAGGNYNFNENHNAFINTGFYSRQPFFDDLFLNFSNEVNEAVGNEKIFGLEGGYGYRKDFIKVDFNAYYTQWSDRQIRQSGDFNGNGARTDIAEIQNVEQRHMGVELEAKGKPTDKLEVGVFASLGNWEYGGDATARFFDENQNSIGEGETTIFLDDIKVGDAAQVTFGVSGSYKILENLSADLDYRYYSKLYASIDPIAFMEEDNNGSLKLPSYGLLDAGVTYNVKDFTLRLNVNNIFNKFYISQSNTSIHAENGDSTYKGIDVDNEVYFGYGTTWNFAVSYRF